MTRKVETFCISIDAALSVEPNPMKLAGIRSSIAMLVASGPAVVVEGTDYA